HQDFVPTVVLLARTTGLTGTAGAPVTVNPFVSVAVAPPGTVMVTFLALRVAVNVMVNVAFTLVSLTTVMPETLTPVPPTAIAVAPVRLVPVSVTLTAVPLAPEEGATAVSVGART